MREASDEEGESLSGTECVLRCLRLEDVAITALVS